MTLKQILNSFNSVQFMGGQGDFLSCGAEGLAQVWKQLTSMKHLYDERN